MTTSSSADSRFLVFRRSYGISLLCVACGWRHRCPGLWGNALAEEIAAREHPPGACKWASAAKEAGS